MRMIIEVDKKNLSSLMQFLVSDENKLQDKRKSSFAVLDKIRHGNTVYLTVVETYTVREEVAKNGWTPEYGDVLHSPPAELLVKLMRSMGFCREPESPKL